MAYPSSPITFPTRLDGQVIFASHVNGVQDEIVAIEQGLLNGLGHVLKPLTDATYDLGSLTRMWRDLHLSRDAAIGGDASVGGDVTITGNLVVGGTVSFPAGVVEWSDIDFTGSSLADLATRSASDLSSGTLPDARFPATLPILSGANLTALNANELTSGTVPDARFPATLPAISGANLTNLNATNLASGTVADARLSANVALLDAANQFSNTNRFTNTGLTILDTNASHVLTLKPGSDLTANKTLTLTTGDADRTITLSGNPTLNDWFDQSVKTSTTPSFVGLSITDASGQIVVNGTANNGSASVALNNDLGRQGVLRVYGSAFGISSLADKAAVFGSRGLVLIGEPTSASGGTTYGISLRGGGYDSAAENIFLNGTRTDMILPTRFSHTIAYANSISPTALTTNTNDWNPTNIASSTILFISATGAVDLTGIVAPAEPNRLLYLINIGSATITLKFNSGSSSVGNKFITPNGGADKALATYDAVMLVYNSPYWYVVGANR